MTPRPAPESLLPWGLTKLGAAATDALPPLEPVAGDASSRRYFRFRYADLSYVLVEAPPATEKNEAFVAVGELLAGAGVVVPAVLAVDLDRGFLLLQDLGDRLLLPLLDARSAQQHYARAFEILGKISDINPAHTELPMYNRALLSEELGRFEQWFVRGLLEYVPCEAEQAQLRGFFDVLLDSALAQPQVLVHRDFHSRNLMLQQEGDLAVIDFQDAVIGPVTYDLVSLLRDCYIRWPADQVTAWALEYREQLLARGRLDAIDRAIFERWFDWMGLQRHIKVLGTFARLYLRDGKSAYLDDLPLVINYVLEIADKYAAEDSHFGEFSLWFSSALIPRITLQSWSRRP